jgi:hypothetical protein
MKYDECGWSKDIQTATLAHNKLTLTRRQPGSSQRKVVL